MLQSVEGMKVVCHELAQATSDPEGSAMDELVKDSDKLVSCLANKVVELQISPLSFYRCYFVIELLNVKSLCYKYVFLIGSQDF